MQSYPHNPLLCKRYQDASYLLSLLVSNLRLNVTVTTISICCPTQSRLRKPSLHKRHRILPLSSQYIFSILIFVVTNKKLFQLNSQVHNRHTRYNDNLHLLLTGLTLVQKGVAYSGCKIYNNLPSQIKKISNNIALFKTTLKKFLLQYIFYSVDEYYQQNCNDYDYQ